MCPIANLITCCQHVIEFKTQLVPPALADVENVSTEVFLDEPVIEDVCPEKVIVCGVLKKKIHYTAVMDDGSKVPKTIEDQRAFQCVIEREDANEGDEFEVIGYDVLCEGTPRLMNRGSRPSSGSVFWRLVEKDIIKVCIRKSDTIG
ncbi:hypothetical protein [Ornithinibacillus californiensis]|uniref:hypothetical protein n=1 Tax=Ornithinibacillus californiensis TaxID=161536 RepID=UPI00069DCA7C|nr:hypothetical protein [Ornithinibacillus californiensis]